MYKSEKWLKRGNLFFDILGYWYVRGVGLYWLIKIVDYNEYFKVLWKNDVLMIIVIISVLVNVYFLLYLMFMIIFILV